MTALETICRRCVNRTTQPPCFCHAAPVLCEHGARQPPVSATCMSDNRRLDKYKQTVRQSKCTKVLFYLYAYISKKKKKSKSSNHMGSMIVRMKFKNVLILLTLYLVYELVHQWK